MPRDSVWPTVQVGWIESRMNMTSTGNEVRQVGKGHREVTVRKGPMQCSKHTSLKYFWINNPRHARRFTHLSISDSSLLGRSAKSTSFQGLGWGNIKGNISKERKRQA